MAPRQQQMLTKAKQPCLRVVQTTAQGRWPPPRSQHQSPTQCSATAGATAAATAGPIAWRAAPAPGRPEDNGPERRVAVRARSRASSICVRPRPSCRGLERGGSALRGVVEERGRATTHAGRAIAPASRAGWVAEEKRALHCASRGGAQAGSRDPRSGTLEAGP